MILIGLTAPTIFLTIECKLSLRDNMLPQSFT
jgi:hypothetical protein